ncbi:MAG: diguanylate cyclase [Dehalococcoidales bacterium]|nr:diguanylate cyclase [Dehalococcoidales bacterium]
MSFNIYAIIPLISVIAYLTLISVIIGRPFATRGYRIFTVFITVSMMVSFCSFILHSNAFPSQTIWWNRVQMALVALSPIIYFHFTRAFFRRPAGVQTYLGYLVWIGITVYIMMGGILKSSYVQNGLLYFEIDILFYPLLVFAGLFMIPAIVNIFLMLKMTTAPLERNRLVYLAAAAIIWAAFMATNISTYLSNYSIDQIGNFLNSLIITYAILKYQLFNITLVARRVIAYFMTLVPLAGIFIGLIMLFQNLLPNQSTTVVLLFATALAFILLLTVRFLWRHILEAIDRFFYRDTYEHRQILLNLNTEMGGIITVTQLAHEILPSLCKVLKVNKAHLLLRDISTGFFMHQYAYPPTDEKARALSFETDNLIVGWLEKNRRPLEMKQISYLPEFKGLWQKEKEQIEKANYGLLVPIENHDLLIGVFALGLKNDGAPYTQEDFEMSMKVSNQAGMMLENAQYYSQALLKANTDGLTQLYNHRHFHEHLDQEISRGSRFGTVFSLIFMDIDHFKTYNDNFGHLAGDEVLRRIGEHIQGSIRNIDIAARYGGEEFAIILPGTSLEDARIMAERIRKTIETRTTQRAMPVTVSLGVAQWPIDGVIKEDLISRADKALYLAKQKGRNCTCLSSEIPEEEIVTAILSKADTNPKSLSILYALEAIVDAKDHYTYGHSRKVAEYAVAIAEVLRLPRDKIAMIRVAGMLHDIGKIGIPDALLNKKETLTEEEWEPIRAHPQLGVAILKHIVELSSCLPAILYHHEYYNGSGYPAGLKGKDIPLEARILCIADAYEAMTSPRVYRKQLDSQEALMELRVNAGKQFDPEIVETFCKIMVMTPSEKK